MNQRDVLDLLFAAIVLLIGLIGLWQGIGRTLLYLAGALLGSEFSLWWADDLGDVLSDWLPITDSTGRFVAATGMIVATMIAVGAGFSPLIWRYPKEWRNRVGGLVAGIVLGCVSLGLILRYYFLFLQTRAQSALGESRLAIRLWEDFQWVILGSIVALASLVIIGWVLGRPEIERGPEYLTPIPEPGQSAARDLAGESRYAFDAGNRSPVRERRQVAPYQPATPVAPPGRSDRSDTLTAEEPAVEDVFDATIPTVIRDTPDFGTHRSAAADAVTYATEGTRDRRDSAGICPNCGMLLRKGDTFCSDCGFRASL